MPFAAVHESESGTKRTSGDVRLESVMRLGADMDEHAVLNTRP